MKGRVASYVGLVLHGSCGILGAEIELTTLFCSYSVYDGFVWFEASSSPLFPYCLLKNILRIDRAVISRQSHADETENAQDS